jgi:hypothetical protein
LGGVGILGGAGAVLRTLKELIWFVPVTKVYW